jgi:spore coat polysaccharide biosynthesis predicted glycosyltransferase SpsG
LNSFLFLVSASQKIGFGHFNRSTTIAQYIHSEYRSKIEIALISEDGGEVNEEFAGPNYAIFQLQSLENLKDFILSKKYDVIITDFMYNDFYNDHEYEVFFNELASTESFIVAIDNLGSNSLYERKENFFKILLRPYVCEDYFEQSNENYLLLQGPQFSILCPEYKAKPVVSHPNIAEKILITFGGSDTKHYTTRFMKLINSVSRPLELKVISGPYFSQSLKDDIQKLSKNSLHFFDIIEAPLSLFDLMRWADIAVSLNGLTKYELAASGLPSLLLSTDNQQDESNAEFSKYQTAVNMKSDSSDTEILLNFMSLLDDLNLRQKLAENGTKLVDGEGVQRFAKILERECEKQ